MARRRRPKQLVQKEIRYGDKRRPWHPRFVEYMQKIVTHPNYVGMPAAVDEEGVIRWNAPSNRPPGSKHEKLHDERLEWWRRKAAALGIPQQGHWISRVAKRIHPYGEKPCQTCGRILFLDYLYPTRATVRYLNQHLPARSHLPYDDLATIYDVAGRVVQVLGDRAYRIFESLFPELRGAGHTPEALQTALRERVVPLEPKGKLSPGAMSNAPDRLDGFHAYNLCCRHKQDTGRAADNLRLYADDRRAFVQWVGGDWAAANALMRSLTLGTCPSCGNEGILTADHIGPISLGFAHRPKFVPACRGCNSARNNRMRLSDVHRLLENEANGDRVISWHARALWDGTKGAVQTDADALRLSKLLRINQHYYLMLLARIHRAGFPDVLLAFLRPDYGKDKIDFVGRREGTFEYERIDRTPRARSYARSKAARMVRIAFDALEDYANKETRNVHAVPREVLDPIERDLGAALRRCRGRSVRFREQFLAALSLDAEPKVRDVVIRKAAGDTYRPPQECPDVHRLIRQYMDAAGRWLGEAFLSPGTTRFSREALDSLTEFGEELLGSDEPTH